jgi:hypothetical protein
MSKKETNEKEIIPGGEDVIIPDTDTVAETDISGLSGYLAPDQVAELKKTHGTEIHEVVVGDKVAYFKKASRATLRAALSFIDKDRLKYMEIILVNCFVGGDRTVLENDDDLYGLVDVVPELTKGKLARIKKY